MSTSFLFLIALVHNEPGFSMTLFSLNGIPVMSNFPVNDAFLH